MEWILKGCACRLTPLCTTHKCFTAVAPISRWFVTLLELAMIEVELGTNRDDVIPQERGRPTACWL